MEQESYKIVYQGGTGEIVEKKSRFIAIVRSIETEEQALQIIADRKKEYRDASHHCSGYVAGITHQLQRCSDDGEPSKTAGRPILDVLLGEDIHNALVVVTRYFGGTLLGTGGLVRAYQKATQMALENSIILEKYIGRELEIHTEYGDIGKIQYLLAQNNINITDTQYTEQVIIKVVVAANKQTMLKEIITEGTNGAAAILVGKPVEFGLLEGKVLLFPRT